CQYKLHGQIKFRSWDDDGIGARHEAVVDHGQQVGEVDTARFLEADDDHRFIRRRNPARYERVRGIDGRDALEVYVRLRELRANVLNVIGHTPQNGLRDVLSRVAALRAVSLDLLNPFKVDHGHDADFEIRVARHVVNVSHHSAV